MAAPIAKTSSEKKFSEPKGKPAKKSVTRHLDLKELQGNSKKKSRETEAKVTPTRSHRSSTPSKSS